MDLKAILEAALFAAQRPLSLAELEALFGEDERPATEEIRLALATLADEYAARPLELRKAASGYRFQVRAAYAPWISRLFEERPGRYSRALLETLAIIAYRQPVTRGQIEEIRGVAVSSGIIRTLTEREWVTVVGHRDVPGRPALFATTPQFLDHFNLESLADLPALPEFAVSPELEDVLAAAQTDPTHPSEEPPDPADAEA
ncbi:Segregation and condensation protein B homolog [Methylococcus capsulatus]|uniref:Segregation and condensation protein B homolog n=1 Tax=Methylococcus capsulatus TaxID=414 RepID=A0AA35Y1F1_METCP|nr:SMC-Scp complex subunit ScpB [Methylococcus capsulatus]CAI8845895.1 Segregation and condensation protein B homolog [Methylococcus capsulatus]